MRTWISALALAMAATTAHGAGWTVNDLGTLAERSTCMQRAESMFEKYFEQYGGSGDIAKSEWTVGGYGLRGAVIDGLVICPIKAGMVEAFLIVHNSDSNNDARMIVADRLRDIWNAN